MSCLSDQLSLLYGVDPLPLQQIVSFNFLFDQRSSFHVGVVRGRVKMGVEPVLNHILKSSALHQLLKCHNEYRSFETPPAQNPCIHPHSVKIASHSRRKLVHAPVDVHWRLLQGPPLSQRNEKYPSIVSLQSAKYPAIAILKYSKRLFQITFLTFLSLAAKEICAMMAAILSLKLSQIFVFFFRRFGSVTMFILQIGEGGGKIFKGKYCKDLKWI